MTEMEKAAAGLLYDANHDPSVLQLRDAAKEKLFAFQQIGAHQRAPREEILRSLLGKLGRNPVFDGPFLCDYGFNIEMALLHKSAIGRDIPQSQMDLRSSDRLGRAQRGKLIED